MSEIKYITGGDATDPQGDGFKLIIHCCNDIGAWGSGFVMALSRKWDGPEDAYRRWAKIKGVNAILPFKLGFCQSAGTTQEDIIVVNMIAQHNVGPDADGFPPIRYWALDACLKTVASNAKVLSGASIHLPYLMGCDLAGGEWDYVEVMLQKRFIDEGIPVTAYDYEGKRNNAV